jgi:galactokinase
MEVVVCYLMQELFGFAIPPEDSAQLCQQAEHEFAGTQCGIMDQFVSVMGREGSALFLDCRTMEHRHIPLPLGDYMLIACDSRVKRGLVSSEYNRRRAECEQGARALNQRFGGVRELRDVTLSQLEECRQDMPENIFRRCRHVVSENERVLASVEAMEHNDIERLGALMNRSHDSLRDDYEVSCAELDVLVETARNVEGVFGSRLTGAGFGGSTITILHRACVEAFQTTVAETYLETFGTVPRFFECAPASGAEQGRTT